MKKVSMMLLLSSALVLSACSKHDQKSSQRQTEQAGQRAERMAERATDEMKKAVDKAESKIKRATNSREDDATKDRTEKPSPMKPKRSGSK